MSKMSRELQSELLEEIYLIECDAHRRANALPSTDSFHKVLKGKIIGLCAARGIISSWNEPNHGKVSPEVNTNE